MEKKYCDRILTVMTLTNIHALQAKRYYNPEDIVGVYMIGF